jgi:hypothetical protein
MKIDNIKQFILIEARKLATDNVSIDTWEAETATKILETYHSRKKWCDDNAEEYDMTTSFQFRKVVVYPYSGDASTWLIELNEIEELAKA